MQAAPEAQNTRQGGYIRDWEFVGVVESWQDGVAQCTQRGRIEAGKPLEILTPTGRVLRLAPAWLKNEAGEDITATPHAMMRYTMPVEEPVPAHSLIRRSTGEKA